MMKKFSLFRTVLPALICCAAWSGAGAAAGRYKDYNLLMISITNIGNVN